MMDFFLFFFFFFFGLLLGFVFAPFFDMLIKLLKRKVEQKIKDDDTND